MSIIFGSLAGFVLLSALLIFLVSQPHRGRFPAQASQAPWMVLIGGVTDNSQEFICSGALVDKQWVLTAAHCLEHQPLAVITAKGVENNVPHFNFSEKVVLHPSNKGYQWGREEKIKKSDRLPVDLGLVKLKTPLESSTISLSEDGAQEVGGQIWGYGPDQESDFDLDNSYQLQRVPARGKRCDLHGHEMFCVVSSWEQTPRTCQGDSGGPMVTQSGGRTQLFAVLSIIELTKERYCTPDGLLGKMSWHTWLTPISSYSKWIRQTIKR